MGDALDRRGHQELAGPGRSADPRRDVDRSADVALSGLDRLAGVDADAQVEPTVWFLHAQLRRRVNELKPAQHRAGGRWKHGVDRVALGLDLGSLVAGDRRAGDLEEAADLGGCGGVPVPLRECGKAAHIGEQKPAIGGSRGVAGVVGHVRQMVVAVGGGPRSRPFRPVRPSRGRAPA